MDLADDGDINFAENEENIMPNEGELDEQELIDGGDNQQMEDNDSESDHRFPYIEEGGWIHWFC